MNYIKGRAVAVMEATEKWNSSLYHELISVLFACFIVCYADVINACTPGAGNGNSCGPACRV